MRNVGASPLHNVRMVVSHRDVFCPMSNQELQDEPLSALSGKLSFDGIHACVEPFRSCVQIAIYQVQSSSGQISISIKADNCQIIIFRSDHDQHHATTLACMAYILTQ